PIVMMSASLAHVSRPIVPPRIQRRGSRLRTLHLGQWRHAVFAQRRHLAMTSLHHQRATRWRTRFRTLPASAAVVRSALQRTILLLGSCCLLSVGVWLYVWRRNTAASQVAAHAP
ncbi:MAG TPA: hypothetical protein VKQ36_07770, partial [Ktedonobacterales bacterium]|nr:hypothetical protein [Ktedonobacterales bacterium]